MGRVRTRVKNYRNKQSPTHRSQKKEIFTFNDVKTLTLFTVAGVGILMVSLVLASIFKMFF